MGVDLDQLEKAVRDAFPVDHLEIEDQSNGCGENYAIVVVSCVRIRLPLSPIYEMNNAS